MKKEELLIIKNEINQKIEKIWDEMERLGPYPNSEYLNGKINGLLTARNILRKYIEEVDE